MGALPRIELPPPGKIWNATAKQAQAKYQELKQQAEVKARQAGDQAAEGLSKAAIFAFVGLVLGAGAAAFGGRQAVPPDAVVPAA